MIKVVLADGKRAYVPLSRVITISEGDNGELTLSNLTAKDEVVWRKIESFELVSAGRKQS